MGDRPTSNIGRPHTARMREGSGAYRPLDMEGWSGMQLAAEMGDLDRRIAADKRAAKQGEVITEAGDAAKAASEVGPEESEVEVEE